MAQTNYYIGVKRGATLALGGVVAGTSSAGTAVDVELNMQIVNSTTATGLTKKDVIRLLRTLEAFILANGIAHAGADVPQP